MVHLKGYADEADILRAGPDVVNPSRLARRNVPRENFVDQRPQNHAFKVMGHIVLFVFASKYARQNYGFMHASAGAPCVRDCL